MIDKNELRNRAEKMVQTKAATPTTDEPLPPQEKSEQILHELQVHQIELEMQNEELRRAQTQLEILQARYFDLYDLAPVGYCTLSEHGLILEANLAAATLLGRGRAALVKQPITRFILEMDQALYYRHRKLLLETGEPQGWELRMLNTDGSIFWARLQAAVVEAPGEAPTWRIVLADITSRKATEEALARAATVQSAIFNSTHFLSIATDTKGLIQVFNIGAERMLGYSAAEVVNKLTPSDFSDPQELLTRACALTLEFNRSVAPSFEALIYKASRGIEDIYELTYLCKDGERLPAAMSVSALRDAHSAIIGYLLIGTDNTSRQRAEAERARHDLAIEHKNIELEIAKTVAEKANLAKSDFLSNMSHELRTPLNAILGFGQILQSGPPTPSPDQKASIDQVLKAGWYLLDLVNEILDLAKIDAGKIALSMEPTALDDILRDGRELLDFKAEKRNIHLAFPNFNTPIFVNADPMRLKQVFVNLLSNAIKFNKMGGTVEVTCTVKPRGRVRIAVQDTGAGLAPDQLSQLFQPFNRLGQKENIVEGTGVGLVVSKRLVELMGGMIGVDSTVGKGSRFWVELDTTKAPVSSGHQSAAIPSNQQAQNRPPSKTVLCVEDNPANLQLVESILARRADICLLSADTGRRGIEIARASQPDVILMDIRLPDISGLKALKILKEDPTTAQIPVIAISAHASPHDIAEAMEAGFFQYLAKPINLAEFLSAMDAALNLRKQEPVKGLKPFQAGE